MAKQRIFISFDYDNDEDIKTALAAQAKLPDSPFDFTDASVKDHLPGDWKEKVRRRINNCDQVIVLCGCKTHTAAGVAAELQIVKELGKPYFLLRGRPNVTCYGPTSAHYSETIYDWSWPNLKALIAGGR